MDREWQRRTLLLVTTGRKIPVVIFIPHDTQFTKFEGILMIETIHASNLLPSECKIMRLNLQWLQNWPSKDRTFWIRYSDSISSSYVTNERSFFSILFLYKFTI
jgi:hypothetical protein